VELTRFCDADAEDGEEPVAWHAERGLQGDSAGTEDSSTDVSELIDGVVEDAAAQWGSQVRPHDRVGDQRGRQAASEKARPSRASSAASG